jgi:glucose dehydrogenase
MNWYHQYVPGDMWDYDEEGSNILIDGVVDGKKGIYFSRISKQIERNESDIVVADPRARSRSACIRSIRTSAAC